MLECKQGNVNRQTNLVKMYMTIRTRMSSIMEIIGPELSKLSALEFDFVYTLASAKFNSDQSVPNLAIINMPIRSRMCLIMDQIEPEHPKLFALKFGKIAESDIIYKY